MSPPPTSLDVGAAWAEDDSRTALLDLGKLLSGETIAERQGRDPSEPQKKTSHEIARLFVASIAPFRALIAEQGRVIDSLRAAAPLREPLAVLVADGESFTAGTVDGFDLAGRRISGEQEVIDQRRTPMDSTIKVSGQIARALRGAVRGALVGIKLRLDALEDAAPKHVVHRVATNRADTFCGEPIVFQDVPGLCGVAYPNSPHELHWTTDALAVTCPECHLAQLVGDDAPASGPMAVGSLPPRAVVLAEHVEAARKVCGSAPDTMGKKLVCTLEGVLERAPGLADLEALARHLELAAATVRTWGAQ